MQKLVLVPYPKKVDIKQGFFRFNNGDCILEDKVYVKTRRSNKWHEMSDKTYNIKKGEGTHGGADPVICRDFPDMVTLIKHRSLRHWQGEVLYAVRTKSGTL